MKEGNKVRVTDPHSAFFNREGEVKDIRPSPLPIGVLMKGAQKQYGTVWFNPVELELVQQD